MVSSTRRPQLKYRPKTKPRHYQADTLKRVFTKSGRYGLFLEPGTGKTKIAIDFMAAAFVQKKLTRGLVVCPKTAFTVWRDQMRQHCPVPYRLILLPKGSRKKLKALRSIKRDNTLLTVVVVNYESTWRIEEAIVKFGPQVIIADEGHRIKNRTAKQSRCLYRLAAALDPYRLLLTGTPIANKPLDVFGQMLFIDDSVFGRSWSEFSTRYAEYGGYLGHEVKRYKNMDDFKRRVLSAATVLTKEECLDLPPQSFEKLPVEIDGKALKHYKEMVRNFVTYLDETGDKRASATIVLTQMLRLSQMTGGFITDEEGDHIQVGSQKLEVLEDKLEDLMESEERVVVFARFRWEIEAIHRICSQRKWTAFTYYGKSANRDYNLEQFQKLKGPGVFIAQIATGSEAIDLTAAAYTIFYSWDYSLIHWTQAHDRTHRSGQARKVVYYYLIAEGTIDQHIYNSMQQKEEFASILKNKSRLRRILTN